MLRTTIKLNIADVKEFVNITDKMECDVDTVRGRLVIDGKSIIGMCTIDLSDPIDIVIHSDNKELLEPFRKWEVQ